MPEGIFHEAIGGSGPTMLLMHGGLGLDHHYLRPTIDSWADFVSPVYYDHRGNGQSSAPDNWEDLGFDSLAEDADALRAELGQDKIILFGHSYGGFIAMHYALQYPERLAGLVLASTAAHLGHPPAITEDDDPDAVAAFGELFAGPMGSDDQWRSTWTRALPLYWPNMDQATATDIDARTVYRADAWNRAAAMLATYDLSDQLSRIEVPTLVLSGAADFLTGPAGHQEIAAAIPNAELVTFEGAGHFPFLDDPEAYRQHVESWVTAL